MLLFARWVAALGVTAFWALASLLVSVWDGSGRGQHACMRTWSRWCLRIGSVRLSVSGLEHADPAAGPFVVVSNHQGQIDILILSVTLPFPFVWVSKKEVFRIPFVGWHMRRAGYVSVDRSNHEQAVASMDVAARRLRQGRSIAFFPEGTRSPDGRLGPFKTGAFRLAIETGFPVLPVAIRGSSAVLPKGSLRVRPAVVDVAILPAEKTGEYTLEERHELKSRVRARIAAKLGGFDAPGGVRYS